MKNSKSGKKILDYKFEIASQTNSPRVLADTLGKMLKDSKSEVSKEVMSACIDKHVKNESIREIFKTLISSAEGLDSLINTSVSYANTMRPLAGNTFAEWVCKTLNLMFQEQNLTIRCETKGKYKKLINYKLKTHVKSGKFQKPDIDIVVFDSIKNDITSILGIISCKTTLAERVGQTLNWKDYLTEILGTNIPEYLVTTGWGDELNNKNKITRERVQSLSGVFVTSDDTIEYGNIKKLSSAPEEFEKLMKKSS
jgi:hypothetical protein